MRIKRHLSRFLVCLSLAPNSQMSRYFVALLPPQHIQDYANQVKQYFADKYASCGAQKSPPHVTLQPPFVWVDGDLPLLEACLQTFASEQNPILMTLDGYGAFAPRVIYLNVVKTAALVNLQADLMAHLASHLGIVDKVAQTRPFAPHMTVAFRDLTKPNFYASWAELEQRQLHFEFTVNSLTLLVHDGQRWCVQSELAMKNFTHGES